jgi:hypothetical protein
MKEKYSWQAAYQAATLETDDAAIVATTLSLAAKRTAPLKTPSVGYWHLRLSE